MDPKILQKECPNDILDEKWVVFLPFIACWNEKEDGQIFCDEQLMSFDNCSWKLRIWWSIWWHNRLHIKQSNTNIREVPSGCQHELMLGLQNKEQIMSLSSIFTWVTNLVLYPCFADYDRGKYFEPMHGSADVYRGKHLASRQKDNKAYESHYWKSKKDLNREML